MGREMRGRHEAATVWQYRAVLATGGRPESVITSAVLEQRPFLGHHAEEHCGWVPTLPLPRTSIRNHV